MNTTWKTRALGVAGVLGACAGSMAQTTADVRTTPAAPGGEGIAVVEARDAADPLVKAHASQQRKRGDLERELKKLRFTYFRSGRNMELRQAGISRLREYDDPAVFPSLLEIFRDEGADVRTAILDQLASYRSEEGDATLAWTAVFDHGREIREAARERLRERCEEAGEVSRRVQTVVAEGLSRSNETHIAAAADVADALNLYQAIPMLISAQLGPGGGVGGSADEGTGALAYILIGKQRAFVANLRPVVGSNAVAFDPTLGVVTDGVFLRVMDASVITYRVDVHNALVRLSSRGWGRDTGSLGWDQEEWRRWYTEEFVPHREAVDQSSKAAEQQGGD